MVPYITTHVLGSTEPLLVSCNKDYIKLVPILTLLITNFLFYLLKYVSMDGYNLSTNYIQKHHVVLYVHVSL